MGGRHGAHFSARKCVKYCMNNAAHSRTRSRLSMAALDTTQLRLAPFTCSLIAVICLLIAT